MLQRADLRRECACKEFFLPALTHRRTVFIIVNLETLHQHKTPCSILVYTTISTIEMIMELKEVIVQVFQDGTHLDDILRHV